MSGEEPSTFSPYNSLKMHAAVQQKAELWKRKRIRRGDHDILCFQGQSWSFLRGKEFYMKNKVIETQGLVKTYRRYRKREGIRGSLASLWKREYEEKTAVNRVNLSVEEGEFVGLIGPNGAGKTTLIKMLTGIIAPTEGSIDVLGYYPNDLRNEFKKQYAVVMGQKSQLFFELTVNDTLRLFKEIYEIPEKEYRETKDYFVRLFGVEELMDVQVRTLSLGERMKMELIVALLHQPKILFLDEPTIGLDAVASRQIRKFLREINEEKGTTILLTSHYMEDIKALCRRTVVINRGVSLYDGPTDELFDRYQKNRKVIATFEHPMGQIALKTNEVRQIEDEPYKKVYEAAIPRTRELFAELMEYEPKDIVVEEEDLGAVVERIYQSEIAAQETGTGRGSGRAVEGAEVSETGATAAEGKEATETGAMAAEDTEVKAAAEKVLGVESAEELTKTEGFTEAKQAKETESEKQKSNQKGGCR